MKNDLLLRTMVAVRPRPVVTAVAAFIVFTTFFLFRPYQDNPAFSFTGSSKILTGSTSTAFDDDELPYGRDYTGHSDPEDANRVTNGTLGFGKVFVVGLPSRTDKRDAMALASSLTGFDIEWIDGVRGQDIPDKAVPFGVDRARLMETNLGSWRAHMNAIRRYVSMSLYRQDTSELPRLTCLRPLRVVEDNLDSALIMEDDMDWDVRLKPQLELAALGARAVVSTLPDALFPNGRPSSSHPSSQPPVSPYGDDWDLLWLGHCGEPFPEDLTENQPLPDADPGFQAMARKWTILGDATVPALDRVTGLVDFRLYPEHSRWVHVTAAPMCTFAYAVSRRGAQKILYDLSVDRLSGPFDNALAGMCRRAVGSWSSTLTGGKGDRGDRGLDAKCVSVTPPLFFHHKAKGLVMADSDIQDGASDELRERGSTENVLWSVRLNLLNMLAGKREMESQW